MSRRTKKTLVKGLIVMGLIVFIPMLIGLIPNIIFGVIPRLPSVVKLVCVVILTILIVRKSVVNGHQKSTIALEIVLGLIFLGVIIKDML